VSSDSPRRAYLLAPVDWGSFPRIQTGAQIGLLRIQTGAQIGLLRIQTGAHTPVCAGHAYKIGTPKYYTNIYNK